MKSKLMLIMVFAIFICTVSATCAADANETTIATQEDNQIELTITEDEIQTNENDNILTQTDNAEILTSGNGSYSDLRADIDSKNLTRSYYRYNTGDGDTIKINTPGIINGNGAVIDMNGSNIRTFTVSASGVTIKNLTIINTNYNGNGGAIYFDGTGTVSNCNFINNKATGTESLGGAVFFNREGTVTNCNFTNNTASGDGGAIYFDITGNVTNCNFTGNTANYDGGAVYFDGTGNVTNCNFTGNTANYDGGAVYFDGTGNVTNCNFTGNTASRDGGAVYFFNTGNLSNCNFTNNKATGTGNYDGGGAVYFYQGTGNVTNCNFTDNTATRYGGAVYFYGEGNVTNCNFADNSASWGGAIRMPSGTVTNCNFTGNTATYGGAIYFFDQGTVTNCNFADNSASWGGGAIFSRLWYTAADTCIFKGNSGDNVNTFIYLPTLNVNNFTTVYGSGEKLTFDLKTNSSIPVTNGNISISVYSNNEWVGNYTCLSGEGWIPDLPVGSYIAFFDTEYAEFQKINRTLKISDGTTFWDLNQTINADTQSEINLINNYTFNPDYDADFVDGIVINRSVTINGNGFTINAKGKARIFEVLSDNVVLKNIIFKNGNITGDGGAVHFVGSGTVENCNFTNNSADYAGGAINMYSGSVENCIFINNTARYGGAIRFYNNGTTTNCNFTNNKAIGIDPWGGAICFSNIGNITNCNFADNTATYLGGAVFFSSTGSVTNCNFTNNSATYDGGAVRMSSGTVLNCNFTGNTANYGGSVYFYDNGEVTNCNFTGNTATGDGGAINMGSGTVSNCNFTGNNATTGSAIYFYKFHSSDTLTVSDSTFLNNRANAGALDIVKTENNITITFTGQNNLLNAIYSIDDAEVTFNNVKYWGVNGITTVSSTMSGSNKAAGQKITVGVVVNGKVVLNEVNVTNENGTIVLDISAGENYYISARHNTDSYYTEAETTISNNINVNVTSQTTTNKTVNITAKSNIYSEFMPGKLLFILPNGTQINATYGTNGTWWAVHEFDKYDVYQVNATYVGLDNVTINNGTITINKLNSTISLDNIVLDYGETKNVTVTTTGATGITAKIGESEANVTGFVISIPALDAGTYTLTVTTIPDNDYNPVTKEVNITVNKVNSTLTVNDIIFDYSSSGSIIVSVTGADGVNATVVGQPKAVVKVNGTNITVSDLDAGTYTLTVTAIGDKNHNNVTKNATITVNKLKTELTGNAITTTYNVNKDLVITLKDITGKALSGVKVTVDLNGAKTYTTDKNGQVKVSTKGIAPKAYTAKVTFNGNTNYVKSTKDIKVTVKKATPKLTAKKKTYKTTPKTKKYTIVLKDNTGKAIKKAKVTLKVKGKTYKATTNSKGKATFKITKLNKKGTFKATITYKGNKYYNKISKKAKIKVIVTFKTVSKGSKDKSTVKEIQQALKDKGYYLTYQGHYLKVDGKFNSCTFRSIKEFQKDKGLKVTGKVDEKTARKLGII